MANFLIFTNGKEPKYYESVDGKEFFTSPPPTKQEAQKYAKPGVLVNPDLSAVANVERKFWKLSGQSVVEMTPAEKQTVLNTESADKEANIQNLGIDAITLAKALIKANVVTKAKLIAAIKEVLNG